MEPRRRRARVLLHCTIFISHRYFNGLAHVNYPQNDPRVARSRELKPIAVILAGLDHEFF